MTHTLMATKPGVAKAHVEHDCRGRNAMGDAAYGASAALIRWMAAGMNGDEALPATRLARWPGGCMVLLATHSCTERF